MAGAIRDINQLWSRQQLQRVTIYIHPAGTSSTASYAVQAPLGRPTTRPAADMDVCLNCSCRHFLLRNVFMTQFKYLHSIRFTQMDTDRRVSRVCAEHEIYMFLFPSIFFSISHTFHFHTRKKKWLSKVRQEVRGHSKVC